MVNNSMKNVKISVVGSRSLNSQVNSKLIKRLITCFFEKHIEYNPIEVISGGAIGPDTFGEEWAIENKLPTTIIKPDWKKHGKSAGFIRNEDIIKQCDICLCFWDGKSKGTQHDIKLCKKYHKPVCLWTPEFGLSTMFTLNEEYEPKPFYIQLELPLTNTPTVGNYNNPSTIVSNIYALPNTYNFNIAHESI